MTRGTRHPDGRQSTDLNDEGNDLDDVNTHRTLANRWPTPTGHDGHGAPLYPWQQAEPAPVDAACQALDDKQ